MKFVGKSTLIPTFTVFIVCVTWICMPRWCKAYNNKFSIASSAKFVKQRSVNQYPFGQLNPFLHHQYLSHQALHHSRFPLELARLARAVSGDNQALVIAGVGPGDDVLRFAEDGHQVIAFEPMPKSYQSTLSRAREHDDWNVTMHNVGLGNAPARITLTYNNVTNIVDVTRLDDVLTEKEYLGLMISV